MGRVKGYSGYFVMDDNITGIILAGGRSSRMGENKSFLPLGGKDLIEVVIGMLSPLFKHLIIITNKPHLYNIQDYISNGCRRKNRIRTESDILKDRGPLGGIHAGLVYSTTMYNFVVACDMPFLNQDLIKYMSSEIGGYDAVMAEYGGRIQPLCAFYSKHCIKPMAKEILRNNLKTARFIQHVKMKVINEDEVGRFDPDGLSFTNINTKKDYQCILQKTVVK